jgi:hypothetical protein
MMMIVNIIPITAPASKINATPALKETKYMLSFVLEMHRLCQGINAAYPGSGNVKTGQCLVLFTQKV